MQCPTDGTVLAITDRQGIEIDYCPTCRGVWLDRGELDKIIERNDREDERRYRDDDRPRHDDRDRYREDDRSRSDRYRDDDRKYRDHDRDDDHRPGYGGYDGSKKKKKSSFLSEIFELG